MNDNELKRIARYCVTCGTQNTTDGSWSVSYDELSHHFGVSRNVIYGNAQLLVDELNRQEEINDLIMTEDCIEMTYHMEHCSLCRQGGIEGAAALVSVLGCNITDEHEEDQSCRPMKHDEVEVKLARHTLWLYSDEGEQAVFSHCKISDQEFIARDFLNVLFDHCRFESVNFCEADLGYSVFKDCVFDNCDLSCVGATGADFTGSDFCGSDLHDAGFEECNFKKTKLSEVGGYPRLQFCCIEDADLGKDNEAVVLADCHEDETEWIAERDGTAMNMQV